MKQVQCPYFTSEVNQGENLLEIVAYFPQMVPSLLLKVKKKLCNTVHL